MMVDILLIFVFVNLVLEIILYDVKVVCLDVVVCIGCLDYLN